MTRCLSEKIDLPRTGDPVDIAIPLAYLDTAGLRQIIDLEPENHNTRAQNDRKYAALCQIQWQGQYTEQIAWRREGQDVVGTFGYCEDASGFIHGFMSRSVHTRSAFLIRDTEDSLLHRGFIREEMLHTDTVAERIAMPPRQGWGVPVEVRFPLWFLDMDGLQERLEIQDRLAQREAARVPVPADAPKLVGQ